MIRPLFFAVLLFSFLSVAGAGRAQRTAATGKGKSATLAPAQLANNSTRVVVGTGDSISLEEFVIAGSESKNVFFRALGPSLGSPGISDFLADPVLSLYDGNGNLLLANDNWRDTQEAEIEATGIAPSDDLEAAIVATLAPGTYAIALTGKDDTTGTAINEVYDLEPQNSLITAIGTRGNALPADRIVITGFILTGNAPQSLLMRALGPSLQTAGVMGVLDDPVLELHNGNGDLIATNDSWRDSAQAVEIEATGLAPTNDLESAIKVTLDPGVYTALETKSSGVTFVEFYSLPYDGMELNPAPVPIPTPTPSPSPSPSASPTPSPTPSPSPSPSPSPTPTPAAKSLNISTRAPVGLGDDVLVGGFIVTGESPKKVLLRALGPSLSGLGLSGFLDDPVLELHGPDGSIIASDDNWRENGAQALLIQASGLAPSNNLESALVATLAPAGYTAIVKGKDGATGLALVEVYDLDDAADSQLGNISTRSSIQSGENVAIGGFVLGGAENGAEIVIRALGPSLSEQGITNALPDSTLELRDENGALLVFNDNWQDNPAQAAKIRDAGFAPPDDLEAVTLTTLPPGLYTAIVGGKNGATGIGLVEIYNLQ